MTTKVWCQQYQEIVYKGNNMELSGAGGRSMDQCVAILRRRRENGNSCAVDSKRKPPKELTINVNIFLLLFLKN